jgi:hypothetical protein
LGRSNKQEITMQIYRATVFYTGKYGKFNKMGGNMFAFGSSADLAKEKMRSVLNSHLVANGFPRDIFTLEVRAVSEEEVKEYFDSKNQGSGAVVN